MSRRCPLLVALRVGALGLALLPAGRAQCELLRLDGHAGNNDNFGTGLAIEGDLVYVGSSGDDVVAPQSGAVHVFRHLDGGTPFDHSDDTWPFLEKFKASDASASDFFGWSVAASADHVVVGAILDDDSGLDCGSAYVFWRDDGGTPGDPSDDDWVQQAKLLAVDGLPGNDFGRSVALDGNLALVGCPRDQGTGQGSAYVFRRDDQGTPADPSDDTWVQQAKLTPSPSNLYAGWSVALEGDVALLGEYAGSRAFVFRRDDQGTSDLADDTWTQTTVLQASDPGNAQFGYAVALDGTTALVSDADDFTAFGETGSVYVFLRDDQGTPDPFDDTWSQQAQLLASDATDCDSFGRAVALDGDTAVIGTLRACQGFSGAAYVFRRDDGGTPDPGDDTWSEQAHLVASAAQPADGYGDAVALDGETALIAAPYTEVHFFNDGTVYAVAIARAPWSWEGHPLAGTAGEPCLFGHGSLQAGQPVAFNLHRAKPSAPVVFIIGTDELTVPFKGGVLVPQLTLLVFGLFTNPAGKLALSSTWPAALPPAFDTTWYQAWIVDSAGPANLAASNGLLGTEP